MRLARILAPRAIARATRAPRAVDVAAMLVEVYARVCVGVTLAPEFTAELLRGFHRSLGLDDDARFDEVYAHLAQDLPRHRQNDPLRDHYESALVAYVEAQRGYACAVGGLTDGGVDPDRGYLLGGVVIDGFVEVRKEDAPARCGRPTKLLKGDLTPGSEFFKRCGPEHKKALAHASKAYARASKMILDDVRQRMRAQPTSGSKEPSWCLVEWLVPTKSS